MLITGASTGIGKACALDLDKRGWRVLAGYRNPQHHDQLVAEGSERLIPVEIDVTSEESVTKAAHFVVEAIGGRGLHGLVNNAGIALAGPLEFLPIEEMQRQLEVNVTGQLRVTQTFLPNLRASQGRIVMMSSVSGRVSTPMLGPYCASKFALEAMTDALRVELMPWNIEVALIEPGKIKTEIWQKGLSWAEKLKKELPQIAWDLYGPMMHRAEHLTRRADEEGVPAQLVADKVAHALMARKPKTRYVIGKDGSQQIWFKRLLPTRFFDKQIYKFLTKTPKQPAQ